MSAGEALAVEHVTKTFGDLRAVDDVSFSVHQGELYGIAGPNGAGKTTLFNVITGIPFRADAGSIVFYGRRIERQSPYWRCRQGLARTFQSVVSFDSLSVEENVRVAVARGPVKPRLTRRRTVQQSVSEALAFLNLKTLAHRAVKDLSLYERKRVMLASALATKPRVLLLDEPASGLNNVECGELETLIRRMNDAGITVLVIEHVLPVLLSVSERVLILHHGRRYFEGTPDEVVRDAQVIEAYLGRGAGIFDDA